MLIRLRVHPGASRTEFREPLGDRLKVSVASPPVEGKANAALVRFLAKRLRVPRGAVDLVAGMSSRNKDVLIRGLTLEELSRLLDG